ACPFDDLQRIVQQGHGLFDLTSDLTRPGQESDIMRHPQFRPSGAVSGRTAAKEQYPLRQIAIPDLAPPTIDVPLSTPVGETLLRSDRGHFVCPLIQGCVVSAEQKQPAAQ